MKQARYILLTFIILALFGCSHIGNKDNPLFGKVYRDASDLAEFKGYTEIGGSVIEVSKDEQGNYKLGFTHIYKGDRHILILDEISKPDKEGRVNYTILDTLTVDVKAHQLLNVNSCRQGETFNEQLIALVVVTDDENDFDKIVKAWLADIKTGTFKSLTDTKGITCFRDEGCGYEEEEYIEEETVLADSTVQLPDIDTVPAQPEVDSLPSENKP